VLILQFCYCFTHSKFSFICENLLENYYTENFQTWFPNYIFFLYFILLLCWVHCGIYKDCYKYQIYHTWIHLLHHSPLSPTPPHLRNSFNRYLFSVYFHLYTVFAPYSPSFTISPPPSPSGWYQTPQTGPIPFSCSPILQKKEKRNEIFAFFNPYFWNIENDVDV
jgi:hypothetical protein